MGGSNSNSTIGSGVGGSKSKCGQRIAFHVSIAKDHEENIWRECEVNQQISLEVEHSDGIPQMLIKRLADKNVIGSVPASYSWVLKCIIEEGWVYSGKIRKKEGNEYNPKISVILNAVKG